MHTQLARLPGSSEPPAALQLELALEDCVRSCWQTAPTVKLVKRHLDGLRDGLQMLQLYGAELTDDAVAAVRTPGDVLTHQAAQLTELGVQLTEIDAATARVAARLQSERPWRDLGALDDDLDAIRRAYVAERQRLLDLQEPQAEQARARIKGRRSFAALTVDQSHTVLRPLALVVTDTTAEAVAPPLASLHDPFTLALQRAEEQANDTLDGLLSEVDPVFRTTS